MVEGVKCVSMVPRWYPRGSIAIENLLILATFSLGTFAFFYLGRAAIGAFFGDGNHYLAIPLF